MAVTIASPLAAQRDASPAPWRSALFAADFGAAEYWRLGARVGFADLLTYSRPQICRYVDPVTRSWVTCGGDVPVMYAPDGQRGLNLAGVQGALMSGTPTAAGSATATYTSDRDGVNCTLICYGSDGAEVSLSGDYEAAIAGQNKARPYEPLHLRLTGGARSLTFNFTAAVLGYKLTIIPWDEWTGNTISAGIGSPTIGLTAATIATLTGRPRLEFRGLVIPHSHEVLLGQTHTLVTLSDADGNTLGIDCQTGDWRLTAKQAVETPQQAAFSRSNVALRPRAPRARALPFDFRLRWDRAARRADLWCGSVLAVPQMTMPDMGALTSVVIGTTGLPVTRSSIKRIAAYEW